VESDGRLFNTKSAETCTASMGIQAADKITDMLF